MVELLVFAAGSLQLSDAVGPLMSVESLSRQRKDLQQSSTCKATSVFRFQSVRSATQLLWISLRRFRSTEALLRRHLEA
jgi:hypothetical protein